MVGRGAQAPRGGGEPDVGDDGETPTERRNRQFDQLLGELRVALPGVQVLFAFLLTVPFTAQFDQLDQRTRNVYLAAISLVAVASILLMAPTIHHRLRFQRGAKEDLIATANRFTIVGMACLGLGLGAALYVAGVAVDPGDWARWIGVGFVVVAGLVWFAVPLRHRERSRDRGR
jgi:hypothetical protein